jgi:hypothetical protein
VTRRALAVAVAAVAATAGVAAAAVADVTIHARPFVDEGTASRRVELTGTISGTGSGEVVEIQARECGNVTRFFRVIGADRAASGGSWRFIVRLEERVVLPAYFRAHWNGEQSDAVLARVPLGGVIFFRRGVVRAEFDTTFSGRNLNRRWAELQRRLPGTDQWVRVRRARLSVIRGSRYDVRFGVRTRGLELRVFLPQSTAGPCYLSGATGVVRS